MYLAPCEHHETDKFNVDRRCRCPNFIFDPKSVPDEITHSELDKECLKFFWSVGIIAEELKRIPDLMEENRIPRPPAEFLETCRNLLRLDMARVNKDFYVDDLRRFLAKALDFMDGGTNAGNKTEG